MLMFHEAQIDTDEDTASVYEYALGEDEPITFPLDGVMITHVGRRAVLTIAAPDPNAPRVVLDRIKGDEPKRQTSGGKTVYMITGASERLYMAGLDAEEQQVSFTIRKWQGADGSVIEGS